MLARSCSVCGHDQRTQIDAALVRGQESKRRIAADYRLSESAVHRHAAEHLPARLVRAAESADVAQAIDVVQQLKAINTASLQVLKDARENGQGGLALAAIDRVQRQIELQAKLLSQLDDRPTVNLVMAPQWPRLVSGLRSVLQPHPEVLAQVTAHLISMEREDADAR